MEKKKAVRSYDNTKINISLKKSLLAKIDVCADNLGITRSAFICMCCAQYINAQEGMAKMKDLVSIMNELKEKQTLSESDLKRVDDMEHFFNMLEDGL